MKDFHCPHCNKKIELSEVAKKQAKILAAQEIKDAKKEAEKKANEGAQRKLDKKDLEIKEANQKAKNAEKKATEEAQKILDKERKQKDLEIKDAKKAARAIALNPEYMLYDEPTTGLDPIMTDSINRLINNFHGKGNVTSVVVTHEMKTVRDVSERVIMLYKGKIQFDGTTESFLNSNDPIVVAFLNGDSTYKG